MQKYGRRHPIIALVLTTLALGACGAEDALAPAGAERDVAPVAQTTADEAATPEPQALALGPDRIAFTSTRKGGYDIYKMDPQGGSLVRLTSFADYEIEPAWSADKQYVALVRPRTGPSNVTRSDIYIVKADGTGGHWARPATLHYDLRVPAWSPDGSRLVSTVKVGGLPYLALTNLATGTASFVVAGGKVVQGNYPSFHPTAKRIIFVGPKGTTVEQVNLDGTGRKLLFSSAGVMASPRFSPDGARIAYSMVSGSNIDIYVRRLSDGTTKRLTSHAASDLQPTWSPDGTRIAFTSTRSGKAQIWVMSASTGGGLTRITHTSTDEKDPAWTR